MELALREKEHVYIVEVRGRIEVSDVDSFEAYIKALRARGVTRFIIEMSQVDSVVSGSLGVLMKLADELEAEGGRLVLLNPNVKVIAVFRRMGLDEVFRICDVEEEARRVVMS